MATLHYWGVKSRAHFVTMTMAYFGHADKLTWSKEYPFPGTPEWAACQKRSAWGQMPYLEDGDVKIGQGAAILQYLCKKHGIDAESSLADFAASHQAIEGCWEMLAVLNKCQYAPEGRTKAFDAAFGEGGDLQKRLAVMETLLGENGFFGTVCQVGDVVFAALCDILIDLQPEVLNEFPKTKALTEAVFANENVKALRESGLWPYFKRHDDA